MRGAEQAPRQTKKRNQATATEDEQTPANAISLPTRLDPGMAIGHANATTPTTKPKKEQERTTKPTTTTTIQQKTGTEIAAGAPGADQQRIAPIQTEVGTGGKLLPATNQKSIWFSL